MTTNLSIEPADFSVLETPLLAIALSPRTDLPSELAHVDELAGGALRRSLSGRDFRGARDETLHLSTRDSRIPRILLVGQGPGSDRNVALRRSAAIAGRHGRRLGVGALAFYAGALTEDEVEIAGIGLAAGAWDFRETKTAPPEEEARRPLASAAVLTGDMESGQRGIRRATAVAEGNALARRLGILPGNICTPDYLADTAREIAGRYGMKVTVLGRPEMEREQMGCFLSVAQGTPQDPKLIVLEHLKGTAGTAPIALVGKGLCFDSGGISIKPAQGMEWMKFDMCGAAGVLGAMEAIGRLDLPTNVVGLIGSTTNMLSGTAVKPGDVVRAANGRFVEVINTDAEGRLVLADVLLYARRFEPAAVIDAATLTGACVVALGHTATGVLGNDDAMIQEVLDAGKRAGEPGWPLPLWDDYKELIKSDVADIKNAGGRAAGTITAALFLKEFAEGMPWVHLDIAGTAYTEADLGTLPPGPTGVPVGTFVEFVRRRAR